MIGEAASALHVARTWPGPDGVALGLLHRDLKPQNLLLTAAGETQVLDFGVARPDFGGRQAVTRGMWFGSPGYVSPERTSGDEGPEADVSCPWGVVLFELLAGRVLRAASGRRVRHDEAVAAALGPLETDEVARTLLADLLAYDPELRPEAREVERRCREAVSAASGPFLRDWAEGVVPELLAQPVASESPSPDFSGSLLVERGTESAETSFHVIEDVSGDWGSVASPSPSGLDVSGSLVGPTPEPAGVALQTMPSLDNEAPEVVAAAAPPVRCSTALAAATASPSEVHMSTQDSKRLVVDGSVIEVRMDGAGPTVVALHSTGLSGRQWGGLCARIEDRFQVVRPDWIGCGGSDDWPTDRPFEMDSDRSVLRQVLSQTGPAHLVGHSYGASHAVWAAVETPHLVRSLSLYEPVLMGMLHSTRDGEGLAHIRATMTPSFFAESLRGTETWLASFVDWWQGEGAWQSLGDAHRAPFLRSAHKIFDEVSQIAAEPTSHRAYRGIEVPMLVLHGTGTPAAARRMSELLAEVAGATSVAIDGAGHMGPLTHAKTVHAAIEAHLDAAEAGA